MPVFNSVLDTKHEKWDLSTKMVGGRGPTTKGGSLYCLSYNGKDAFLAHGKYRKHGGDAETWQLSQRIYDKYSDDTKGDAGKKMYPNLAAAYAGHTHGTLVILDMNKLPPQLMKFGLRSQVDWLELDPLTMISLACATGAYSIGSSFLLKNKTTGMVDPVSLSAYMLISGNLFLATPLMLSRLLFGVDENPGHALWESSRSSALPSLRLCQLMELHELQDVRKHGLPEIYRLASEPRLDGTLRGVDVVVMDFGKELQSKLVNAASGSLSALRMLSTELGAQVTPLLRNLFQRNSDELGNHAMLLARKLDGKRAASQVCSTAGGVTVDSYWCRVPAWCTPSGGVRRHVRHLHPAYGRPMRRVTRGRCSHVGTGAPQAASD